MIFRWTLLWCLFVAGLPAMAQPWTFTRIPNPPEPQVAYGLHWQPNIGYTVGTAGVVRWDGQEQTTWTFALVGSVERCGTVDENGEYVGLTNGRYLVRVQGDSLIQQPNIVFTTSGTAMERGLGSEILLSRPHALQEELYVYHIEGVEIVSTDTLDVDSVVATRLYRRPTDGAVFLSARHVVNADTTVSTWTLTTAPFPWQLHTEAIWGDVAFFGNGERAVVPDSIERAGIVAGNTIIGMKGADRGRRWAMFRSTDGGATFHPLPGLDTLRATVTAHGTWFDSTLACATTTEFVVISADGSMTTRDLPRVEQSENMYEVILFPGRTDAMRLGMQLYNTPERRWDDARPLFPDSLSWHGYIVAEPFVVISDSLGRRWRWNPVSGQNTRMVGDSGIDVPFAGGMTRADGLLWLTTTNALYEIAEDGHATRHRLALPRYENGLEVQVEAGPLECGDRSLLFGTRVAYREGDSSKLVPTADLWGVLRTTDNGQTWTMHNDGLDRNTSIWDFARASDGVIYVGAGFDLGGGATRGEVYRSTNDGRSWTQEARLLPATIKREFRLRTGPEQELLVIGEGLVYRRRPSHDWYAVPGPWGEGTPVYDAMILPGSRRLVVATQAGLFMSDVPVSVSSDDASIGNNATCRPQITGRTLHVSEPSSPAQHNLVVADLLGRVRFRLNIPSTAAWVELPADLERGAYLISIGDCKGLVWLE